MINLLQAEVQLLVQERDDVNTRFTDLKTKLESGLPSKNVEIEQHENDRTVIRVTGDILFDAGSAELSDAGREALGHIAAALIGFPAHQVSLEGHTDTVPISGTLRKRYATNWELSIARATSAVRYLQLQGIDAARLRAVGYGEFRPVADNDDPQVRERNRRLEIRLLPGDGTELEQDLSVSR
jgi:chemotaxis protein MotB